MKGKRHTEETKYKISKNRKGKRKGKEHPNWKGGVSEETSRLRNSLDYRNWKLAVYKRDKGFCQTCGKRCNNSNIVAHHIKNFKDFIELRFDINNGVTLCRSCHCKLHNPKSSRKYIKK